MLRPLLGRIATNVSHCRTACSRPSKGAATNRFPAPLGRDRQRSVTVPLGQRLAESKVEKIARLPAVPFDRRIGASESKAQIPLGPRALPLKRHNQDDVKTPRKHFELFAVRSWLHPLNQFRAALSRYSCLPDATRYVSRVHHSPGSRYYCFCRRTVVVFAPMSSEAQALTLCC